MLDCLQHALRLELHLLRLGAHGIEELLHVLRVPGAWKRIILRLWRVSEAGCKGQRKLPSGCSGAPRGVLGSGLGP